MSIKIFFAGLFGGFLVEVLHWFKIRHEDIPHYAKKWIYWVITALMIICGGVLAIIYAECSTGLNIIVAMNIGASAPLIIQKLASSPTSEVDDPYILGDHDKFSKSRINIRNFLRG